MKNDLKNIFMVLYGPLRLDSRVLRECKTLSESGHNVTVVCPNMGFDEWQDYDRVRDTRVVQIPFEKRTKISSILRFWLAVIRYLVSRRNVIDVLHAHDLTGLVPAALVKLVHRKSILVYDSHELYPEAAWDKLSLFYYFAFLVMELISTRLVDHLITVSPSIVSILTKRIQVPCTLLMNVPETEDRVTSTGSLTRWKGFGNHQAIRIAYTGNVHPNRGYEVLPKAASSLRNRIDKKFEFWIIGDGPILQDIKNEVSEMSLDDYFHFTGRLDFELLLENLAECDIALALYDGSRNNSAGLSNKIFEYMSVGIPFIFSDLAQSLPILHVIGTPFVENPVSGEDVAKAIAELIQDRERLNSISSKGLQLIDSKFNWKLESRKLVSLYESL